MQTPAPTSRRAAAVFAVAAGLLAVLPQAAFAGIVTPDSAGSPVQSDTNKLFLVFLVLGGLAILAVAALVAGAARSAGADERTAGDSYDTAKPVVFVSGIAFLALAVVSVLAFTGARSADASLAGASSDYKPAQLRDATLKSPVSLKPPKGPALSVQVNGQQYLWRYSYLGETVAGVPVTNYHDLVVPVGVTVLLDFTSSDVLHGWWVPQLGGTYEAVPGYINRGWIRVDEAGVYKGYSTRPSGPNYPSLTTTVRALPADEFEAWLASKKTDLGAAYDELAKTKESGTAEEQIEGEGETTPTAPGADTPPSDTKTGTEH